MHLNPAREREGDGAQGQMKPGAGGGWASEGPSSHRESALWPFPQRFNLYLNGPQPPP